jgi:hypothetical protein
MPNQVPLSRYLLLGFAALMLGAALPDMGSLVQRAREMRQIRAQRTNQRTVIIDRLPVRQGRQIFVRNSNI